MLASLVATVGDAVAVCGARRRRRPRRTRRRRDAMKQRRRSGAGTPRTTSGNTRTPSRSSRRRTRCRGCPRSCSTSVSATASNGRPTSGASSGAARLHYYEALVREAPVTSTVRPDADQFIAELGPAVAAAEAHERAGEDRRGQGGGGADSWRSRSSRSGSSMTRPASSTGCCASPTTDASCWPRATCCAGASRPARATCSPPRCSSGARWSCAPPAELAAAARPGGGRVRGRAQDRRAGRAAAGAGAARRGGRGRSRRSIDVKVEGDSEKMVAALELGYRNADTGAFLTDARQAAGDAGRPGRRR